jgi:hypothetical protein
MTRFSLLLTLFLPAALSAQDFASVWLPLQGSATIRSLQADVPLPESDRFYAKAWPNGTDTNITRSLLRVDLSPLGEDWILERAELDLFGYPTTGEDTNYGLNEAFIERVVQPWDPSTVTWNTQPPVDPTARVAIDWIPEPTADLTGIDVTQLVRAMQADPSGSHGLCLRFRDERIFRKIIFSSPTHPDPALRPRLRVFYRLPSDTSGTTGLALSGERVTAGPNPFRDRVSVAVDVRVPGTWTVAFHDASGRLLEQRAEWRTAGPWNVEWRAGASAPVSGLMLVRVTSPEGEAVRRLIRVP